LMTYGWAILVVLVVIGALAYFGVMKPETSLPERCELQQGFYCDDHRIVDLADAGVDYIQFNFQNGRGTGMMVERVVAHGTGELKTVVCDTGADLLALSWAGKSGLYIDNGASQLVTVPCGPNKLDDLSESGKKKFDLEVVWYDSTSTIDFSHTMKGQLLANIELQ